jgi:Uma2 family endonuclease
MPQETNPDDYFEIDNASEAKHELVFGNLRKLPGGSPHHSQITANTCIAIGKRLAGGNCRVFDSSLRVCLDRETGIYVYPDLTVVEGEIECLEKRDETLVNPKLVVEVLSPASFDFDLGSKARLYTKVPTLTDLLLIDQDKMGVEHWVRCINGHWDVMVLKDAKDVLKLESLNCEVPLAEIYAGVANL